MKIGILTPTRGRPEGLYRLFRSINETISGKYPLQFIFCIDNDDIYFSDYYELHYQMKVEAKRCMQVKMIEEDRKPIAVAWNNLMGSSNADWFFPGADDLVFKTKDWDLILAQKIEQIKHPFHLFYFDDSVQRERLSTFPIVSKYWVKTLGYFYPEIFKHNFVDTWLFDIACSLGVQVYVPEVIMEHLHFSVNPNVSYDDTYAEGLKDNAYELDQKLFSETEQERIYCTELIKLRINDITYYADWRKTGTI